MKLLQRFATSADLIFGATRLGGRFLDLLRREFPARAVWARAAHAQPAGLQDCRGAVLYDSGGRGSRCAPMFPWNHSFSGALSMCASGEGECV